MKQLKIIYSTRIITALIVKWLRSSVDEGLRILIWVIMWDLVEKYINMLNGVEKGLIIVILLILLQKDVLRTYSDKNAQEGNIEHKKKK